MPLLRYAREVKTTANLLGEQNADKTGRCASATPTLRVERNAAARLAMRGRLCRLPLEGLGMAFGPRWPDDSSSTSLY
jgi:hypothetical protein